MLDESSLDCGRRNVDQLLQIGIFRRNFHYRACFAHGIEISARRKGPNRSRACPIRCKSDAAPALDRAWKKRCRGTIVAPGLGNILEILSRIAATARGRQMNTAALRIAALVLGRCPARRLLRRRMATTTGIKRRSRTARPRSAERLRQSRAAWRREVPVRPKRRGERMSA